MVGAMVYAIVFYLAFAIFFIGFIHKIIRWANLPVPLNIPTTGSGYMDNPKTRFAVILRMASEVFLFKSLWRNTRYDLATNEIRSNRVLWLGSMVFHISFFLILIRHFRLFLQPVPPLIATIRVLDPVGTLMPGIQYTGILIVIALLYLTIRRFVNPEMRYISIIPDYFVLLLLLAIIISGNILASSIRPDIIEVKAFMLGIFSLSPMEIDFHWFFFVHFLLVCVLLAYFPFSKLMHAPGIFFSPTRNQINNPRLSKHVNPWDYPVGAEPWKDYRDRYESGSHPQGVLKDVEE